MLSSILDVIGLAHQRPYLTRDLRYYPMNLFRPWDRESCLLGIGQPHRIKVAAVRHALDGLRPGHYMIGHVPYQERLRDLFVSMGIRTFFVIRDPRAVVASQVPYYMKHVSHYLYFRYRKLGTDKERLMAAIRGLKRADGKLKTNGIAEKLALSVGWLGAESVQVVRFEDMIGEQGGGSKAQQIQTTIDIGSHIGLELSEAEALAVGERAFGQGHTFRQGRTDSWREVFDEEAKDLFKELAGEYLIQLGYEADDDW